jgi:hypothetical protein
MLVEPAKDALPLKTRRKQLKPGGICQIAEILEKSCPLEP